MKTSKHNFIWTILLCTTLIFGQKQTKKIDQSFKVNRDVLVEINTQYADVTVETWNKNTVSIKGVWQVEGMTKEEADAYFEGWNFEALGNKNKVVITSKSYRNYHFHSHVFDDMDFDFDFDHDIDFKFTGELFNGDYYSELPPVPPIPPLPEPFLEHLSQIEFDHKAYEKDKDGYLEKFQKRQEKWQKEYEATIEPQMELWRKKMEPKMKEYEEMMKKWEKEMEPKIKANEKKIEARMKANEKRMEARLKANEKRMEARMKVMEAKMKRKYAQKIKEKGAKNSMNYNIKKSLVIKVPKGATLKVNAHHGKVILPAGIKVID